MSLITLGWVVGFEPTATGTTRLRLFVFPLFRAALRSHLHGFKKPKDPAWVTPFPSTPGVAWFDGAIRFAACLWGHFGRQAKRRRTLARCRQKRAGGSGPPREVWTDVFAARLAQLGARIALSARSPLQDASQRQTRPPRKKEGPFFLGGPANLKSAGGPVTGQMRLQEAYTSLSRAAKK